MVPERIVLSSKDILDKEFKIDTRGYRPQEVDKFLDLVIQDYEQFFQLLRENESDKKSLIDENFKLKQEIRSLKTKLEVLEESFSGDVTSADVLRRISNLEKFIYDKE